MNSQVQPENDISTGRPVPAGMKLPRSQWRKHVCLIWWEKPEAENGGQSRLEAEIQAPAEPREKEHSVVAWMVEVDLVRYLLLDAVKSGEQLRILSRIALIM